MIMSKFEYGEVIGFEITNNGKIDIYFKCNKCKKIFLKNINLDRISTISCDYCKYKFVFIPLVVNEEKGDIIEYTIINYGEYRKLLADLILKEDISKEEKRRKILNYIRQQLV